MPGKGKRYLGGRAVRAGLILLAGWFIMNPWPVPAQDPAGVWINNGQTVAVTLGRNDRAVYNLALPADVTDGCIRFFNTDGLNAAWYTFSNSGLAGCLDWKGPPGGMTCEGCGAIPSHGGGLVITVACETPQNGTVCSGNFTASYGDVAACAPVFSHDPYNPTDLWTLDEGGTLAFNGRDSGNSAYLFSDLAFAQPFSLGFNFNYVRGTPNALFGAVFFTQGDLSGDPGRGNVNQGYEVGFKFDGTGYAAGHYGPGVWDWLSPPAPVSGPLYLGGTIPLSISAGDGRATVLMNGTPIMDFGLPQEMTGRIGFFSYDGGGLLPGFNISGVTATGCQTSPD